MKNIVTLRCALPRMFWCKSLNINVNNNNKANKTRKGGPKLNILLKENVFTKYLH